jgi:glycosyltransferase involved in cell wall biosynthesis
MIAPNSEGIPPSFVRQLKDLVKLPTGDKVPAITGLLAPSKWAAGVLQREFPDHRVIYCPHGVLPEFRMEPELRALARAVFEQEDVFRLLHVTSSRLSRKGTRELVKAWQQLRHKTGFSNVSKLDILINPEFVHEFQSYVNSVGAQGSVQVVPGQNFKIENYVKGMQGYNFVVQPSRAEGFGLTPLEARACGVPVIATRATGHLDHMEGSGISFVEHGDVEPSDDYLGASAPTVSEEQILSALEYAYEMALTLHDEAVAGAAEIYEEWQWERVVAPAVEQMKELV